MGPYETVLLFNIYHNMQAVCTKCYTFYKCACTLVVLLTCWKTCVIWSTLTNSSEVSTSAERFLTCRLCFLPLQGERGYSIPTYITAVYCVLTGHVQRFCQHPVSYSVGLGKCSQGSQCIQLMYYCWHAESLTNCVTHVSCSEIPLVHWMPWTAMSPYNITTSTWLTQCL